MGTRFSQCSVARGRQGSLQELTTQPSPLKGNTPIRGGAQEEAGIQGCEAEACRVAGEDVIAQQAERAQGRARHSARFPWTRRMGLGGEDSELQSRAVGALSLHSWHLAT